MLPELGSSFGITAEAATASITAYLFPFAAVMLVSGTLGERWGRRRSVTVAYVGYVVASVACALAPTLEVFLAARALQGVANAFTTPLLLTALSTAVPADRLGRALGWFGALSAAGQSSAPLVGGLAAEVDWRLAFGGAAAAAALLAVVGIPGEEHPAGWAAPGLRSAWSWDVVRVGVAVAVGWGCLYGLGFLVALRLQSEFGVGAGPRGLVLTAIGAAGLLAAPAVGRAVDRAGARRATLAGAALGALVVLGVGLAPAVWLVTAIWAVGGVATQLVLVGVNALVLLSVTENRGGAMSAVQAIRFGGGALAPAAFTPLYLADPALGFLAPALLIALVVPLAIPRSRPAR